MDMLINIPLYLFGAFILYLLLTSFFTVKTAEIAVIQRFGKFLSIATPGLNWKVPIRLGTPAPATY